MYTVFTLTSFICKHTRDERVLPFPFLHNFYTLVLASQIHSARFYAP